MTALKSVDVPVVVVGGIAVALLGRPRFTRDIDVLVELEESRWPTILEAGRAFGIGARIDQPLEFARRSRVLRLRHARPVLRGRRLAWRPSLRTLLNFTAETGCVHGTSDTAGRRGLSGSPGPGEPARNCRTAHDFDQAEVPSICAPVASRRTFPLDPDREKTNAQKEAPQARGLFVLPKP
jgi:hypothetical protein